MHENKKIDEPLLLEGSDENQSKPSIQVHKEPSKMVDHIPCLFLPYDDGSNKIIIYFHGNAEDIGLAFDLLYLVG